MINMHENKIEQTAPAMNSRGATLGIGIPTMVLYGVSRLLCL
jgi:hypothetical protein